MINRVTKGILLAAAGAALGLTSTASIAASCEDIGIYGNEPSKFATSGWDFSISGQGEKPARRAETTNRANETFVLTKAGDSDFNQVVITIDDSRFEKISRDHAVMFRFDGGDVITPESHPQIARDVDVTDRTITITNWLQHFDDFGDAKAMEVRWVDDASNEHITRFTMGSYCRAYGHVNTDLDSIDRLLQI